MAKGSIEAGHVSPLFIVLIFKLYIIYINKNNIKLLFITEIVFKIFSQPFSINPILYVKATFLNLLMILQIGPLEGHVISHDKYVLPGSM